MYYNQTGFLPRYPGYPGFPGYPGYPGGHSPGLPPGTHIDPHATPFGTHYNIHIPGPYGGLKLPYNPYGYYPH